MLCFKVGYWGMSTLYKKENMDRILIVIDIVTGERRSKYIYFEFKERYILYEWYNICILYLNRYHLELSSSSSHKQLLNRTFILFTGAKYNPIRHLVVYTKADLSLFMSIGRQINNCFKFIDEISAQNAQPLVILYFFYFYVFYAFYVFICCAILISVLYNCSDILWAVISVIFSLIASGIMCQNIHPAKR